ncbi:MAG: hypothetical protein GX448_06300 [Planctomycetes bacterium]|nr:hypothetical protein [Planctomycetota bacterium]
MTIRTVFLVTVCLGMAGCGGAKPAFYWYHPDRTFDEAKAEYAECEVQAEEEAEKITQEEYFERLRSPVILSGNEQAIKHRKKLKKSEDPADLARAEWREIYKQNAFSGCMTSRGYVQLREYQVPEGLKTKEMPLGAIAGRRPE